jgi:putative intracellular protease/amidase
MKKVLMIIAEGSEAVEIVAPVDVLRRTEGVNRTIELMLTMTIDNRIYVF